MSGYPTTIDAQPAASVMRGQVPDIRRGAANLRAWWYVTLRVDASERRSWTRTLKRIRALETFEPSGGLS